MEGSAIRGAKGATVNRRFSLGRARIDVLSLDEAVRWVMHAAASGPCRYVVTPNSDHIVMLETHGGLAEAYAEAHLVVADGMPLVWASRLIGPSLPERVTGSELMPRVCAAAAQSGDGIFLLGAGPGVAAAAQVRLEREFPGLRVVGTYCPPLGFERDLAELEKIRGLLLAADPAIVFVGLGAPKQELWMHAHYKQLARGVLLGVGASIDFAAGQARRAPVWMQKSGSEWVYRLLQEPRRLAKRYLKDTFVFWIILREFWNRKKEK